jgi:predicted nucleic acid-binding protein
MTRLLLDSNVLIDANRGVDAARAFLRAASQDHELWSITPVRTELLAGARPNETAALVALMDALSWQDVTTPIADAAGAFAATYRRSHQLSTVDVLLAAAAVELDAVVATLNVRDFPMFPGLKPPY